MEILLENVNLYVMALLGVVGLGDLLVPGLALHQLRVQVAEI
jgi:hypothetical protein